MLKSFALIAIAALSLAACSKNEAPINNENEMITLKFNIRNADDASTRALLGTDSDGKKFLNWENGDQIGSYSVGSFTQGSTSYTASNNNAGTVEVSGDSYVLNVQAFYAGSITDLYTYYPYSSNAGKNKTEAIMTIPASQFMNADGFDADAMPMAGTPVSVDLTTEANKDVPCGTINFFNLGSIINFKIYSSEATDETLTSVKYIAETGNLGGSYTIDLTAVDGSDESTLALAGAGSEAEITTTHRANPAIGVGKANAIDVYMVVAPGTYSGTKVVVTTSAKTYTLSASGAKTYTRSSVKPMYVDIQKGEPGDLPEEETWTKVTKASDFTAGTYYILRADGAYYVPNATGNPSCVAYTTGDAITTAMRWNASVNGSGLVFESAAAPGNYLWTTNTGSANTISVTANSTGASASKVWTFATVSANETTYYTATAGANKYLVSYGTSNWRYYGTSNINASNIPAEFYKLQTGDTPVLDTPELTFNNPTTSVNIGAKVTNVATIDPATLTVTYSSSNTDVATVIETTGEVTGVAAGKATITASFAGNDSYAPVSATYEITVVDPNANDGSAEKPYTASEAVAVAKQLGTETKDVYVKGIVCTTGSVNTSYHSVTYYISDDGSTTSRLQIYSGKYVDGADFTDENNLRMGDYVVVYGTLKYYNNSTPEIDKNSEIQSIFRAPTFSPDGGSFATDNTTVEIVAETGATIRYTVDGTNPTATTGEVYSGPITISATTTVKAIAIKDNIVTGVSSTTFTKTSSSDILYSLYSGTLTEGDYVIVYNGKAMKNTVSSNRLGYAEVTVSGNDIANPDASIIWHIAANGSYWTIYNAEVNQYAAGNGTKNQAALEDAIGDKSLWTVSTSSGTYDFVNKYNSASNVNANLRNNGTYGFACYGTGTGGALSLYKKN